MPRAASSTGLIAARTRPVRRPKPKKVELLGLAVPAPFTLRPFAGLFNPFPYGCSVLCNHPADGEAKDVLRRARDTRASEGKALLLATDRPIEALPTSSATAAVDHEDAAPVPEELFRRYTQTDSRPPSPEAAQVEPPPPADTKERANLVIDLKNAISQEQQENETFSWHSLTPQPLPSSRRTDLATHRKPPTSGYHRSATSTSTSPARPVPILEVTTPVQVSRDDDDDEEDDSEPEGSAPIRRRGKVRRKKRKCRRGSIYGQQTEVREPPDPAETQVSQIQPDSRRGSVCPRLEETKQGSVDKTTVAIIKHDIPPSFLPPEVLKELCRQLDRDTVEFEFNAKRRFALEEALRVMGDVNPGIRGARQSPLPAPVQNAPRLFYRKSARFELLDSSSLVGVSPLEYLGRHVYVTEARKALFGRVFKRHQAESGSSEGPRRMECGLLGEALSDVMGRQLEPAELAGLEEQLAVGAGQLLDFRTWCGVCAFAERTLAELQPRQTDPPTWLERADFDGLEARLANARDVRPDLVRLLRLVRDR